MQPSPYTREGHDDVIKWKHFPRHWPFVRGIPVHRWITHTKASEAELWCFPLWCQCNDKSKFRLQMLWRLAHHFHSWLSCHCLQIVRFYLCFHQMFLFLEFLGSKRSVSFTMVVISRDLKSYSRLTHWTLIKFMRISRGIDLKWRAQKVFHDTSALVQAMAWCR